MGRKHKPDEIIGKLREAEVVLKGGLTELAAGVPRFATESPARLLHSTIC